MARKTRKAGQSPGVPAAQISPVALRLAVPALIALFSLFAWIDRGVHEDGFFYLRVADVFLHGGGLAYNPGERFETNTDFLWSLLLIPGPALGLDDILWMQLLGIAIGAAALWGAFSLARRLLSDAESALVALVLLGTHYTFVHFAATGFGVVLQALAALCALLGLRRFGENPSARNGVILGAGLSFLALCRLDSVVLGVPVALCALFFARRRGRSALPGVALGLGIPAAVAVLLLAWKLHYYGDILPATYYTKGAVERAGLDLSDFKRRQGVAYLTGYWTRYFLWLLAAIAAFGAWKMSAQKRRSKQRNASAERGAILWTMAAMCVLWHGYIFSIGGGYAEFRFMAATAPPLMILLAWGFSGLARHWRAAAALAAAGFSLLHMRTDGELASGIHAGKVMIHTRLTSEMRTDISAPTHFSAHRLVGGALAELLAPLGDYPPDVKVASQAGGLPAYLTKVAWVETHGYADSRISRANSEDLWFYPENTYIGHHIYARPKWLARHGVNFVLEVGHIRPRFDFSTPTARLTWAAMASISPVGSDLELPPDSQLFALPLGNGLFAPVLYFNRNQTLDRLLDERNIERVNVL